jgi:tRNA1(Val) A37 N6-methylase TrmN6
MSFADADLSRDAFLDGRLRLWQPRAGYRAAIDPVLLAAFVPARPGDRALELGCGAGTALLCLGARVPGLELHGLELQPAYAGLARRNAAENGVALVVHEGDLRRPPAALRTRSFDHLLANPPYHPAVAPPAGDPGRDTAHREGAAALADWIDAGLRRLAPGGRLALIHRPDRLGAILAAVEGRVGSVEILPVAPRAGAPAGRVLVRARKGARGPTRLWPPLTMHADPAARGGTEPYTETAEAVLRHMRELLPETSRDSSGPP